MPQYMLGIDGGGTHTRGVLANSEGHLLAYTQQGASNPNDIGLAASCARLTEISRTLIQKAHVAPEDCSLYAGVAGSINHQEDMLLSLRQMLPELYLLDIGSDVDNLLSSELPTGDGACIICGTGSCCFLRKGQQLIRIGGWGYLLDSAGSGYDIGRQGLEAVLRAHDLRDAPTRLTETMAEALGKPVWETITRIYTQGKPYIASMAPVVFATAEDGDATANDILNRNAAALAEYIVAANRWMECSTDGVKRTLPVVLGGGIHQHYGSAWSARILAHVPAHLPVTLRIAMAPPVLGAAVEAYRRSLHLSYDAGGNSLFDAFRSHLLADIDAEQGKDTVS